MKNPVAVAGLVLALLLPRVSAAEETTTGPAVVAAAGAPAALASWPATNRVIRLGLGHLQRHYTEYDDQGITVDGIFDEERGRIAGIAGLVRWQGEARPDTRLGLLLEGELRIHAGDTQYRGYLIPAGGGAWIPYNGETSNLIIDTRLRAGLVLCCQRFQIAPFVELRTQDWYRDLNQYAEVYWHTAVAAGVFAQWRLGGRWVLEADAATGHVLLATLDAPFDGFPQDLGNEPLQSLGAGLRWQAGDRNGITLQWRRDELAYGKSAVVVSGMYEPDSDTVQESVQLALEFPF